MNLDVTSWRSFRVGRLFVMLNGKGITQEEIADNEGDFSAVQSGEENNGVMGKINLNYCKQMGYVYSEKPCLTVARSGSAGFVSFQIDGCVVGDSAKIMLLPDDVASVEVYIFLQSVLTKNRFKYTYGRKVTKEKYLSDLIDLPIQYNSEGVPIIDDARKYSDDGYIPDWRFMEEYIKSLHYRPLTTKNKSGQTPDLNIENWKEFCLGVLFKVSKAHAYNQDTFEPIENDVDVPKIGCITRTANNNGLDYYGELNPALKIESGNALTIGGEGVVCFYQPEQFICGTNMSVLRHDKLNKYNGLFISRVIDWYSKDRFSYGRAFNKGQIEKSIIKLPAISDDEPDWQFMEDYIKALPYGDRLSV